MCETLLRRRPYTYAAAVRTYGMGDRTMSYVQFQQQCLDCKRTWNATFGIVGMTRLAEPPTACPYCESARIEKCADGWDA